MAEARPAVAFSVQVCPPARACMPLELVERLTRRPRPALPPAGRPGERRSTSPLAWEQAQRAARNYLRKYNGRRSRWAEAEAARAASKGLRLRGEMAGAEGRRRRSLLLRSQRATREAQYVAARSFLAGAERERRRVGLQLENAIRGRRAGLRRQAFLLGRSARAEGDYWSARLRGMRARLRRCGGGAKRGTDGAEPRNAVVGKTVPPSLGARPGKPSLPRGPLIGQENPQG